MSNNNEGDTFAYRRFFDGERVRVLYEKDTLARGIAGTRGTVKNYVRVGPHTFVAVEVDGEDLWFVREAALENHLK